MADNGIRKNVDLPNNAHDRAEFAQECTSKYVFTIHAKPISMRVGRTPEGERLDLQYPATEGAITTKADAFVRDWWTPLVGDPTNPLESFLKDLDDLGYKLPGKDPFSLIEEFRKEDPDATKDPKAPPVRQEALKNIIDKLQNGQLYALEWFGFAGDIVSGSDWVLVRNDRVAEFSGRFTLRSSDYDGALLDAAITGVVDYASRVKKQKMFRREGLLNPLPLVLAATFDAAGAAQSWAPSRLIAQSSAFWKYQRLTQGQFVAIGHAMVEDTNDLIRLSQIDLNVYELRANYNVPGPAAANARSTSPWVPS